MFYGYHSDHRITASYVRPWYKALDERSMTATIEVEDTVANLREVWGLDFGNNTPTDDDGLNLYESGIGEDDVISSVDVLDDDDFIMVDVTVSFRFDVCPTCRGKGTHVNPSIDAGGLSREDFDRDPDFEEAYLGGVYDVNCARCKGKRVVPVPDDKRATSHVNAMEREAAEDARAARMGY